MAPQSLRQTTSAPPARRRKPAKVVRLGCEQFEDRIAPALFNVQSPLSFTGLNNNGCVAVADFNKDGIMDAVMTNFGTDYASGAGSTITILYGKSGGGFTPVTLSTGGTNPSFVAVADINGDGWPDLVVCNANKQGTGSVSVFKNDGHGNLSLVGTPFSTFSNNAAWVGLADMTGDHVLDVVVASFGKDDGTGNNITGNNITIFQGNADAQGHGDFTFSSNPITTLAPSSQFIPTSLAIADFNGDGILDIAATVPGVPADSTQPQPDGSVYVFQGTGSGGFAAPNQYDSGGALPVNIQVADLNGDNKPDLVVANAGDPKATPEFKNNSVGVLLNVSSGGSLNFGPTNSLTANCYGTFAVAVADFNLDGKPDIAAVNYGSQTGSSPAAFVSIYLGDGTGSFAAASPGTYDTQTNSGGGQYLAVGDFDGNGTPDLIVAHASNLVGLLLNTSTVTVASTTTTLSSSANPSTFKQAVTITATVQASAGTVSGGTVTFFDNGNQIGNPVNLVNQQATLTTSSLTVGTHPITATYSGATGFSGSPSNQLNQVVNYGAAQSFSFAGVPTTLTAGSQFGITVTALDQFGNLAGGYLGTIHFTSSDLRAGLPADYTFTATDNGAHTFATPVTLVTAGSQTVTATDTTTSSITGTSSKVAVTAASATHFNLSTPATATTGTAISVSVTALDPFNNVASSYLGTIHFTSSDAQAGLPPDYPFVAGDNGLHTFASGVTFANPGNQTVTATDTTTNTINGTSPPITVSAAPATHFSISIPTQATAGAPFDLTITALDQSGNTASGYLGTVHFTSTDPHALLPTDYTFKAGDNGAHTFPLGATLEMAGSQTVTGTDTATSSITGTSGTVAVSAAAATHFSVSTSATATAGTALSVTVTALDPFNNTATSYTGTVHFTSSDPQAVLPPDFPFGAGDNGVHTFAGSVTLETPGNQTVTASDTKTASITGTSGPVAVSLVVPKFPVGSGAPLILVTTARVKHRVQVRVLNADGSLRFAFFPYGRSYRGGVHWAIADVNGDGFPDVVVTSATAPVQKVKVYDGRTGAIIQSFSGAPRSLVGGVHVAAGDLNGTGMAEVVIGAGSQVRVFNPLTGQLLFRATPLGKRSVRVAVVDLTGSGVDDFLALTKSGSRVAAFDGRTFQRLSAAAITMPMWEILAVASR
jgi:hypothetical protein